MANAKHVAILKQGVKTWNAWRNDNPFVPPDLSGADFLEADLSWAIFTGTILTGVAGAEGAAEAVWAHALLRRPSPPERLMAKKRG